VTNRRTHAVESTHVNHNHRPLITTLTSASRHRGRTDEVSAGWGFDSSRRTLTRHFVDSSYQKHHSRSTYASFTFLRVAPVTSALATPGWFVHQPRQLASLGRSVPDPLRRRKPSVSAAVESGDGSINRPAPSADQLAPRSCRHHLANQRDIRESAPHRSACTERCGEGCPCGAATHGTNPYGQLRQAAGMARLKRHGFRAGGYLWASSGWSRARSRS
jgi:hypothetical protein